MVEIVEILCYYYVSVIYQRINNDISDNKKNYVTAENIRNGENIMKYEISDVQIYRAVSKMSRPIADATHTISDIAFYVVELTTVKELPDRGIC